MIVNFYLFFMNLLRFPQRKDDADNDDGCGFLCVTLAAHLEASSLRPSLKLLGKSLANYL